MTRPEVRTERPSLPLRALGFVRLVHPFPVATVVITSVLLVLVAHRGIPGLPFLIRAGAVVLLSQIPVGALNDYVDRDVDAASGKEKPIPEGLVSPQEAIFVTVASLVTLAPLALTFGPLPVLLVVIGTVAGLIYDLWLKSTPFSFVGYLVGFLSLATWVWVVAGHVSPLLAAAYPVGALLVVAAHLAQSLSDIERDRMAQFRGLAVVLGRTRTLIAIGLVLLLAALVDLLLSLGGRVPLGVCLTALGVGLASLALPASLRPRPSGEETIFRLVAVSVGILTLACLVSLTANS